MRRFLVAGGFGFFGSAVVAALRAEGLAPLVASRRAGADVVMDVEDQDSISRSLRSGDVVIDAVGPFQRRTMRLVEAAAAIGFDLVDLADSLNYVAGVYRLLERIEAARVRVFTACSGMSSVSDCAIRMSGLSEPVRLTGFLVPATRQTAVAGTAASLFLSVGRPIEVFANGSLHSVMGWESLRVFEMPSPLVQVVSLIALITRAVDFAHQRDFVHRDLNPSKILIDTKWQPHVTDFGLGIELGRTSREEIGHGGTPTYMAPEQALHDVAAIGSSTDVWALGGILAVLVTFQSPFQADTREEQFDRILNTQPDLTTIADSSLQQILQRCLVKESRERTDSALKFAEQLEDWLRRYRKAAATILLRTKLLSVCVLVA